MSPDPCHNANVRNLNSAARAAGRILFRAAPSIRINSSGRVSGSASSSSRSSHIGQPGMKVHSLFILSSRLILHVASAACLIASGSRGTRAETMGELGRIGCGCYLQLEGSSGGPGAGCCVVDSASALQPSICSCMFVLRVWARFQPSLEARHWQANCSICKLQVSTQIAASFSANEVAAQVDRSAEKWLTGPVVVRRRWQNQPQQRAD